MDKTLMQVWIEEVSGIFPRLYYVLVNGQQYDVMQLRHGKRLSRNDMRDIAAGYKEYLAFEEEQ